MHCIAGKLVACVRACVHAAPSVARGTAVRLHVVCCRGLLRLGCRSSAKGTDNAAKGTDKRR